MHVLATQVTYKYPGQSQVQVTYVQLQYWSPTSHTSTDHPGHIQVLAAETIVEYC